MVQTSKPSLSPKYVNMHWCTSCMRHRKVKVDKLFVDKTHKILTEKVPQTNSQPSLLAGKLKLNSLSHTYAHTFGYAFGVCSRPFFFNFLVLFLLSILCG